MQRYVKMVMLVLIGLFGLVGALYNVFGSSVEIPLIGRVANGEGVEGLQEWQKVNSPILIWFAWSLIPICKCVAGILCLAGAWNMWQVRTCSATIFHKAKQLGLAGCGVLITMIFGIFILVSETWFMQWQTELGVSTLSTAHRYLLSIGILMVYIEMSDH